MESANGSRMPLRLIAHFQYLVGVVGEYVPAPIALNPEKLTVPSDDPDSIAVNGVLVRVKLRVLAGHGEISCHSRFPC
jgi:hypothetical protein